MRVVLIYSLLAGCSSRPSPERPISQEFVDLEVLVEGQGVVRLDKSVRFLYEESSACERRCQAQVRRGQPITLSASPNNSLFFGWSPPCGSKRVCTLSPKQALRLTASFAPDPFGITWIQSFHSTGCIVSGPVEITDSGIIVAHLFSGDVRVDSGGPILSQGRTDALISKLAHSGRLEWTLPIGSSGSEALPLVAALDEHTLVAVPTGGPVKLDQTMVGSGPTTLVAQINSAGNVDWVRSTPAYVYSLARIGKDRWIIAYRRSTNSVEVQSIDLSGTVMWARTLTSTKSIHLLRVLSGHDAIALLGDVRGVPSFDRRRSRSGQFLLFLERSTGNVRDTAWFNDSSVRFSLLTRVRDDVLLAGTFRGTVNVWGHSFESSGRRDILLVNVGSGETNSIRWARQIGSSGEEYLIDISGGLKMGYVSGITSGYLDLDIASVGELQGLNRHWFLMNVSTSNRVGWGLGRPIVDAIRGIHLAQVGDGLIVSGNFGAEGRLPRAVVVAGAPGCHGISIARLAQRH